MRIKTMINKWPACTLLALAITGCGLVPNMNSESMSSAEEAVLFMQMGKSYLELGKLEQAKKKLETALHLDSGNADIHNAMGEFYERIKEYDQAKDSYSTAVRKAPDNYMVAANYGRFLCDRGDYKNGMDMLQKAMDQPMNNRQWFALTGMGDCYAGQEDLQHAEDYLRQALLLQPDFPPALQEMQKISYQKRQYMSARAFLERYLSVSKHTAETLWYAFQTERALGNSGMAEEYGELLINNFPVSKEAQEIRAALGK